MRSFFRNHTGHLTPLIYSVIMATIWLILITVKGHEPGRPEIYLITSLLGMMIISAIIIWTQRTEALDVNSRIEVDPVDPWEMQRLLMIASSQSLPQRPTINNGSILYALLMMEELGETLTGLSAVTGRLHHQSPELIGMTNTFAGLGHRLQAMAKVHRDSLTRINIDEPLRPDEAVELFDGTTDVAVVNCGFALASGLPGAAGYDEVARSNLSKINPMTGVIDKTSDGKWIKGRGYFKPNLTHVLHLNRQINDHQEQDPVG